MCVCLIDSCLLRKHFFLAIILDSDGSEPHVCVVAYFSQTSLRPQQQSISTYVQFEDMLMFLLLGTLDACPSIDCTRFKRITVVTLSHVK